ncbi:MAG: type II secretion system F family protein [Methanoregula sp.]|nr:MAG: type II secretion system F family protein [Methanoregula sp.]
MPIALARADAVLSRYELVMYGSHLRQTLRGAHIPFTAERYLQNVHINVLGSVLLFVGSFLFLTFSGYEIQILSVSTSDMLFWVIVFAGMIPGLYLFQIYYPAIIARGRKTRIELDLPYAISYMEALSTTMPPYEMIQKIYEEQEMFGEVSREFGVIVRDVEVFNDDLITAMRDLQRTTPSAHLRDFLNDLSIVSDSGGAVNSYISAKTQYYRDQARQELDLVLKTIEIMAEVYVSAFVAGPIALIIMIVAQGMTSHNQMDWLLPFMYLCIPAGAIIMIWLLSAMLPPENLEISRRETIEHDFAGSVPVHTTHQAPAPDEKDASFYKRLAAKKRHHHLLNRLRHPLRSYISKYDYSIGAGVLIAGIIAGFWMTGWFDSFFPKNTPEAIVCLIIIGFMTPVAAAYEGRRWYVRNIESHIPEFLRELSDMKDIGITLHDAIQRISNAKLGVLSSELSLVSRDIESGAYVNTALVRMEERIGLVSVKRTISLLVRASEITHNLRQIFLIAITDFEHYLKLKRERANATIIYVMIIYLSFGIYLYTAYQLNVPFLASFTGMNIPLQLAGNITDMFRIGIILGTFSGIMAGQFSSNSILCGFKHSIALLAAALVVFTVII